LLAKKFSGKQLEKELKKLENRLVLDSKEFYTRKMSVRDSLEHYIKMIQGAAIITNNKTGAVLTYVGGKNHSILPYDLVMAKRQMASTFKPFVYTSALNAGINPCDYIDNSQVTYEQYDNWTPKNSDGIYDGFYSMKGALTKSANVVSVKLYLESGYDELNDLAQKLNLVDNYLANYPSVALGVESSSLFRLTTAYDIFPNNGLHNEPYFIERIEDRDGNEIYSYNYPSGERIISELNSELIREMLKGVVNNGTAQSLRSIYNLKGEYGAKTGTAQSYSDAWTIVFNKDISIGVWSGFFNPNISFSNALGYGSKAALPIAADVLKKIENDKVFGEYRQTYFKKTSEPALQMLDCVDYKEDNFFQRNFDFLEKDVIKENDNNKNKKNKKSFWKRLFG
jgi:penicillin-binding protein 1A